jgi:hypothetical protein
MPKKAARGRLLAFFLQSRDELCLGRHKNCINDVNNSIRRNDVRCDDVSFVHRDVAVPINRQLDAREEFPGKPLAPGRFRYELARNHVVLYKIYKFGAMLRLKQAFQRSSGKAFEGLIGRGENRNGPCPLQHVGEVCGV